jgi:flagellar basal-body rod protein FlgB
MPTPVESITTAALSAAFDAASRRQALTAANIANAGTDGYLPLRLSFEAELADAQAALREQGVLDIPGLESLRRLADLASEPVEGAASVQLDAEMVELARNSAHFQALVQGVSRHLALLALAAADGRK